MREAETGKACLNGRDAERDGVPSQRRANCTRDWDILAICGKVYPGEERMGGRSWAPPARKARVWDSLQGIFVFCFPSSGILCAAELGRFGQDKQESERG